MPFANVGGRCCIYIYIRIYIYICQSPILVCPGSCVLYFQSMTCKPLSHLDPGFLLYPLTHGSPKNRHLRHLDALEPTCLGSKLPRSLCAIGLGSCLDRNLRWMPMDPIGSELYLGTRKTRFGNEHFFSMTSTGLLGVCFVLCVFNVFNVVFDCCWQAPL